MIAAVICSEGLLPIYLIDRISRKELLHHSYFKSDYIEKSCIIIYYFYRLFYE